MSCHINLEEKAPMPLLQVKTQEAASKHQHNQHTKTHSRNNILEKSIKITKSKEKNSEE